MPDITFTPKEQERINTIIDELDPADHELLHPYYDSLAADDWQFVCDYVRAKMRAVLETGMLIRSVAEKARATKLVDEEAIRNNFVRTLWNYNFSFQKAIEDTFVEVAGGHRESPLCVAVEALVEVAEDLMFGTFEDAHEQLLDGAGT
ncbi:MAG: hypothetical protein ACRDK3_07595 [Actinomycetota bacterium]